MGRDAGHLPLLGGRDRRDRVAEAREFLSGFGLDVDAIAPLVDERFFSGFIRARKPAR